MRIPTVQHGYFASFFLAFAAVFAGERATAADALAEAGVGSHTDGLVELGYLEEARVGTKGLQINAKLDTGADTSSVHAHDVEIYTRAKKGSWVRFRLIGKNDRWIRYDQRVLRFALIKTKNGGTIRRPVIKMPLCVGDVRAHAEINLADRDVFDYEMLIGREFLAGRVVVNSAKEFAAKETCAEHEED